MVLVGSSRLSGCVTIEENPRTGVGAGLSAAGVAIGYYLDCQDRPRAQAVSDTGYMPAQGTVVRVERVHAEAPTVRQGRTVNLTTTHTVLTHKTDDSGPLSHWPWLASAHGGSANSPWFLLDR